MGLALQLGRSMEEMESLTATETLAWLELDKPVDTPPPSSIKDFLKAVRRA
jgi:hypothetical protein